MDRNVMEMLESVCEIHTRKSIHLNLEHFKTNCFNFISINKTDFFISLVTFMLD